MIEWIRNNNHHTKVLIVTHNSRGAHIQFESYWPVTVTISPQSESSLFQNIITKGSTNKNLNCALQSALDSSIPSYSREEKKKYRTRTGSRARDNQT